jgi:iron complex outermembrane receptor protein
VIASAGTSAFPSRSSASHNIYNISLSHHFTRDFMVYGNTGTSFRSGFFSPGIQSQEILGSSDPLLQSLSNHPAETSKSYEVGFKWTFLDGRGRLNFDVYRQKFNNFTIYIPNINYNNGGATANFAFTQPVDALVKGFEVDAAFQITPEWNVGLLASYSDGAVQGTQVVCNTFNALGQPTYNYQGVISTCPGGSASRLPYWNATLTSEYVHPVMDDVDGFVRGLFSYYPKNENRMEPGLTVDNYGLLNLYAGLRSHDGAWEVSVFAKNALNNETLLDRSPVAASLNGLIVDAPVVGFAPGSLPSTSGYYTTQVTPPREIGVNVRYAWGTR